MEKCKKKRNSMKIYLSSDEREEIELYTKRMGYKKIGNLIRDAVLYLARNPAYDFIFDSGSLFKGDPNRLIIRQRFLKCLDETLDVLEESSIVIPKIQEEGERDG